MQRKRRMPLIAFLVTPCLHTLTQNQGDRLAASDGAEVVLLLNNGQELEGELLSVRE